MQTTQLLHDNVLTEYFVNHDHKLILRITDIARDDNCEVQIHHTNYPELKVIIDSEAPVIGTVQTQINMDLELRISEEYLMYRTEELLMSNCNHISVSWALTTCSRWKEVHSIQTP